MRNLRLITFLSLLLVTLLGFIFKYYPGPAQAWINNNVATIWYEIFWCLLIFWFIPKGKAISKRAATRCAAIAIWVFGVSCVLEILQLWQPPFLQLVRSHLIGRLLIGTTFSGWDFVYYVIGCWMGWLWMRQILSR